MLGKHPDEMQEYSIGNVGEYLALNELSRGKIVSFNMLRILYENLGLLWPTLREKEGLFRVIAHLVHKGKLGL